MSCLRRLVKGKVSCEHSVESDRLHNEQHGFKTLLVSWVRRAVLREPFFSPEFHAVQHDGS